MPTNILEHMPDEGFDSGEVHGVFSKVTAYIVRQNIKTEQTIEEAIVHEVMAEKADLVGDLIVCC